MRLFARGCSWGQLPYVAAAGGLSLREQLDLEAHAAGCADCTEALRDAVAADVALRRAFAPLRRRHAVLAPGRVRMALGPGRREVRSAWLRIPSFFARLAEVSVAVGVTMFVLTGSLEAPRSAVDPAPRSVIQDYFHSLPPSDDIDYFRWLRLQPAVGPERLDGARLPVGGRFDVDPVELVTKPSATPR